MKKLRLVGLVAMTLPILALAQADSGGSSTACTGATLKILHIIQRLISWGIGLTLALGVLVLIYAAFLFLFAQGDDSKIQLARKYIVYVVVAVAVALLAGLFVELIIQLVRPNQEYLCPKATGLSDI